MKELSNILILILLMLAACKKSTIEQPQSQLKGNLLLADEGGKFLNDNSGVTISIENSHPLISTISDKQGNFVLQGYPSSSFVLVYSKPGYGTYRQYFEQDNTGKLSYWSLNERRFVNEDGSIGEALTLGQRSTAIISDLKTSIIGDTLQVRFNLSSPTPGQKAIELLTQKDLPNISFATINKNRSNWHWLYLAQNGDNVFNWCLKCSELCNQWSSGEVIYFTAYGESYYSNMYVDRLNNNDIVMPNMNTANTVTPTFVVAP